MSLVRFTVIMFGPSCVYNIEERKMERTGIKEEKNEDLELALLKKKSNFITY